MIAYLLKSTACLIILLLVYHLLLEREKMYHFNRYFLLFGLPFSFIVPLLAIEINLFSVSDHQLSHYFQELQSRSSTDNIVHKLPENIVVTNGGYELYHYILLISLYCAVSLVLVIRFVRNLYIIYSKIHRNERVSKGNVTLVLTQHCNLPHSFFHYIFIDKNTYRNGNVANAVLDHEEVHARQKHSLDILFIEILKIVLWFNPAIYFYKKAIQLNHEFLADEAVLANTQDVSSYQKLLLRMKSGRGNLVLTSSIHYSITKKRFIMMTKQSNRFRKLCKQLTVILMMVGLLFLFGTTTTHAQDVKRISITELVQAVYNKMESIDSLSNTEKQKLTNLIVKMQDELNGKISPPPPPPTPVRLENDITKQERAELEKHMSVLRQKSKDYKKVTPDSSNMKSLQATYSEMMKAYNNFVKRQKEIYGENEPPPPPILRNPSWRIQNNQ